jgi:FKBP-type peptidyl-prolyl cis-trans isomerase FkpA
MKNILYLFVFFALFSCGGYSKKEKDQFDQKILSYLKKNKINAKKSSSGVYTATLAQGTGEAVKHNDIVRVIYKGSLLNGKIFDKQLSPIELKLKDMIPAWREALLDLKEGSSILIITPPYMAYGNQKVGKIPENSILIFDITLFERK